MPAPLTPFKFKEEFLPSLQDFWCGSEDFHHEVAAWICGRGDVNVITESEAGLRVWVFKDADGEIVGFGSLGTTTWMLDEWDGKADVELHINYIPMLGIHIEQQQKGYGTAVLDFLLDRAEENPAVKPIVGLHVHPENRDAIRLYKRQGFEWVASREGYSRMMVDLSD